MGIADIFGYGKKEEKKKKPFRIPAEASAISTVIDAENRENFPKPDRYQEIVKHIKSVFDQLDEIIAQREYAEEAIRIKKDLKKKLAQLTEKVNTNKVAAEKESNEDYVADNLAYLERKGMRNQAKTHFTECLDAIEAIMKCCQEDRPENWKTIESATGDLIKAMSTLHDGYFTKHGEDREIKTIREELLRKIEGLNSYFETIGDRIKEKGLEVQVRSTLADIARETAKISEM